MKVSLIIPFKDEIDYAKKTMGYVHRFLLSNKIDFEIVAVDDSIDGTWEILQEFSNTHEKTVVVKGNQPAGYGQALRKGFQTATGDIIIPFNGDLSDSLEDVISYIRLIADGYDMVFGSRFLKQSNHQKRTLKSFLSIWGNRLFQGLFWTDCNDLTNSFKAYRKNVLDSINHTAIGYNINMEIALKGILKKYKYTTIPINYKDREFGQSKMLITKVIPKYLLTGLKIRLLGSCARC